MSNNRKKQVDEFVEVDNKDALINVEEFDGIPLSRYFYNTKTIEVFLYMPICEQYKKLKPTVAKCRCYEYEIISLISSDNGKRMRKPYNKFIKHANDKYHK